MKTIRQKISVLTVAIVTAALVTVVTVAMLSSYTATMSMTKENLVNISAVAAERVRLELESYESIVEEMGYEEYLTNKSTTDKVKQANINVKLAKYGFTGGSYINMSGIDLNGNDHSDKTYFQNALAGKTTISEPMINDSATDMTLVIAAPVYNSTSNISGCVYITPNSEFLNDIMRSVSVSENSLAYLIDSEGYTIADEDAQLVLSRENCEVKAAAGDSGYNDTAELHSLARSGEAGFYDYHENGIRYFSGYAPVGINGWSFIVWSPATDFISSLYTSLIVIIIIAVVALLVSISLSAFIGKKIGTPIRLCADRIKLLAQGDLTSPVPDVHSNDETGILAQAAKFTVDGLNNIIGDIHRVLSQMADGNLNVSTTEGKEFYIGDYEKLLTYMNDINLKLSSSLEQINTAAEQVNAGSDQVSDGAQALSQGATEQAASIEELASIINVIADKTKACAVSAKNASEKTNLAGTEMGTATQKLDELVAAMEKISNSSEETKKIIKVIEDIAFQTNILALNAAIEAARAGAAGKGFAVVADEVRNLAGKSADAANETTALIEETVEAIEQGNALVSGVAEQMNAVAAKAGEVAQINDEIQKETNDIAQSSAQITVGIDQISIVVQANSATAEQSAAAAEELTGQSLMLRELVGEFTLRDNSAD